MGKTFLFAGASSAMAQECRKQLQQAGNRVIGMSRSEIEGYDDHIVVEDYCSALPTIDQKFDGLVYFPGSINLKPFSRITQTEFLSDLQINALGAANFVQSYCKQLLAGSSVVLFSTVAVKTGMPFHSSVSMSKGAVEGLTRSLAAELSPNIRVNCIAPSLTDTPMAARLLNSEEKIQQMKSRNPLREIGSVIDLSNMVCFLLGNESRWITGQVLAVDGGMGVLRV